MVTTKTRDRERLKFIFILATRKPKFSKKIQKTKMLVGKWKWRFKKHFVSKKKTNNKKNKTNISFMHKMLQNKLINFI